MRCDWPAPPWGTAAAAPALSAHSLCQLWLPFCVRGASSASKERLAHFGAGRGRDGVNYADAAPLGVCVRACPSLGTLGWDISYSELTIPPPPTPLLFFFSVSLDTDLKVVFSFSIRLSVFTNFIFCFSVFEMCLDTQKGNGVYIISYFLKLMQKLSG